MPAPIYCIVDAQSCAALTLAPAAIDELVQKTVLYGLLRRTPSEDEIAAYAKQARTERKPASALPAHIECPLSIHLKSFFRVSGTPEKGPFPSKKSYDFWLTALQLQEIRRPTLLAYTMPTVPLNKLTISLEGIAGNGTQSL